MLAVARHRLVLEPPLIQDPNAVRYALAAAWGGLAIGGAAAAPVPIAPLVAAGAVALACLALRPRWLPVVLVLTVFGESLAVGGATASRVAAPVALAVTGLRLATQGPVALPRKGVLVAAAAYAVWALVSIAWSTDVGWSLGESGTPYALASLGIAVTYMIAFAVLVEDRRDLQRVLVAVWVCAVAVGLVGIGQYIAGDSRATGYVGDPNFFATSQLIALPLALVLASRARDPGLALVLYGGAAVIAASTVTSLSRGGLLAMVLLVALIVTLPGRGLFRTRGRKVVALAVLLVAGTAIFGNAYDDLAARADSALSGEDTGAGRGNLWRAALTASSEEPVLGIGYGAFQSRSNELMARTPGVDFSHYRMRTDGQQAHSAYLGSLAELGVPGLALLVVLIGAGAVALRRTARAADRAGDDLAASVARALLVGLAAFAFSSLFLSSETNRGFWVVLGLALALPRLVEASAQRRGAVS